ncbi:MAG: hypothetical protein J6K58_06575 [Lachnospiraceae bacterium]|nr:hypothetical protein [Lachnospiraceae bacterium]
MYILEPVPHKTIWGGIKLNRYVPNSSDRLGHLYMVNGHKEMSNVILNGDCKGKTLREIFADRKREWDMEEYEEFPLTIALVDAADHLSIQVHPDDITAEEIEHERIGKTESWVFLDAPGSGWIYAGCRCKTKKEVETAVLNGEMEQITGHLEITKGDYVCVEAGTLHAMTAGCFVYEIEYGSDYTYRFYDYDRRDGEGNARELHIDKALKAINPQIVPKNGKLQDEVWMRENNYEICRKTNLKEYKNNSETLECVSVIEGEGECENCPVKSGMSILLLPGEEISNVAIDTAMVARIRKADGEKN